MPPPCIPKDTRPVPIPPPEYPIPTLSIRVETLTHEGAALFFDAVHPTTVLRDAIISSFTWLYTAETVPTHVEAILLVLRPMDGVAYTFGSHAEKEIHFSLDYILGFAGKPSGDSSSMSDEIHDSQRRSNDRERILRVKNEIYGVLVHEVVHCYQYNAKDTCPGGLIEGIADYVRLNAGYVPPHWRRTTGDKWDAGYQTTGYFLDWIEQRTGPGTIRRLNGSLHDVEYDVKIFKDITGSSVTELWDLYCEEFGEPESKAIVDS